jgi:hypothetical protein
MREVLYVSERKLQFTFTDAASRGRVPHVRDISLGVPGIASSKVSFDDVATEDRTSTFELDQKLERVISFLDHTYRPADFTSPSLTSGQWVKFDLKMRYGTSFKDSANLPLVTAGDIALFGGAATPERSNDSRPVELLLCGTSNHLRYQISPHGRMGSGSEWLYDVIKILEKRDRNGISVLPEFLTDLIPRHRSILDPGDVARMVYGGLMRSDYPRPDQAQLRGHAKVLLYDENPRLSTRFVLATPLYVEAAPPDRKSLWPKWLRRK